MNTYYVQWSIELDAESPEEAARKALEIQRDVNSIATIFNVCLADDPDMDFVEIDVEENEE